MLRDALVEVGEPAEESVLWTTHACRRGAGADILFRQGLSERGGLREMLTQGYWASARSAFPYTPKSEVEEVLMGEFLFDNFVDA